MDFVRSAHLPYMALLSLDDINACMPRVALQFLRLQHTQHTSTDGNTKRYYCYVQWRTGGGFGVLKPPRNSEVLTKLSRIPSSVENTSVTT